MVDKLRCLGHGCLPSVDLSDQLRFAFGCPALDVGFLRHALLHLSEATLACAGFGSLQDRHKPGALYKLLPQIFIENTN